MTEIEQDKSSPNFLAERIKELMKGDERAVTQEQLSLCIASMLKVENIFTRLLILITEVSKGDAEVAKAASEEFSHALLDYRKSIGDILVSAEPTEGDE